MYTGLVHSHSGLAYLVLLTSLLSLLLSLFTATAGVRPGVLKAGNVLRIAELALVGLIGLIGFGLWFALPWPLTTWWLWTGVAVLVVHGGLMARGIKPAIAALREQEEGAWRWVALAAVDAVLVWGIFGLMHAKPGL